MKKLRIFFIAIISLVAFEAEAWYGVSPYAYCAGDPVNYVDPTGERTQAVLDSAGHYTIVGGDINDNDRNIYLMAYDQYGELCNTGISIGRTPVMTSFYNSDTGEWAGSIDSKDESGIMFLMDVYEESPNIIKYMMNAGNSTKDNYQKYDFKVTNGTGMQPGDLSIYRGMPIGYGADGVRIYTSARDIGNMVAGAVARRSGLPWSVARLGFDGYQGSVEGISSQNAQRFGFNFSGSKYYHNYFNGKK